MHSVEIPTTSKSVYMHAVSGPVGEYSFYHLIKVN